MDEINKKINKEFKDILRVSFSYGFLQIFQIGINIVKTKFIAIILGPSGVGISNLFHSTTGVIASLANNGLTTSAIKEIADSESKSNEIEAGLKISAFKKLLIITGFLCFILCFFLAPFLSNNAFDSDEYIYSFQILSIGLFINQVSSGYGVLLRSRRLTKKIIISTIISSLFSLIISIPILYYFNFRGIVPSIIITSLINLLVLKIFTKELFFKSVKLSYKEAISIGKSMISSGFFVSLSSLFSSIVSYIFISYLSRNSSVDIVGFYSAGFAILNTYVGLIFNSMAQDFYPRLSSKIKSQEEVKTTLANQMDIAILLIVPLLIGMIFFNEIFIEILYTDEFLVMSQMIIFASVGILCKIPTWATAFFLLASGKFRIYFYLETFVLVLSLCLNIICFEFYGLMGLGISSSVTLVVSALVYVVIAKIPIVQQTLSFIIIGLLIICLCIYIQSSFGYFIPIIFRIIIFLFSLFSSILILINRLNFNPIIYFKKLIK
jgi:O-antigen/teichoic acid export membrane protein